MCVSYVTGNTCLVGGGGDPLYPRPEYINTVPLLGLLKLHIFYETQLRSKAGYNKRVRQCIALNLHYHHKCL